MARLGRFFGVLEPSGVDFKGFGEVLGRVLEAPETYFSRFFHVFTLGWRKRSDPYKTLPGAIKIKVCAVTPCTEIDRKSYPGPFRTKVPAKNVSKIQRFFGHGALIAARHSCWHSLSAFHNHPAARRYVRSTWNFPLKRAKY